MMRLAGAISEGSGRYNEDACGYIERDGEIIAAWVLDGVTGINEVALLPGPSDAYWLVQQAQRHLSVLAAGDLSLLDILAQLVDGLMADWHAATQQRVLPAHYDHPAACLVLAKKYADGWNVIRLGDSVVLSQDEKIHLHPPPASPLHQLEETLRREARRRRGEGHFDFTALLAEFRPRLVASRQQRNTPGNYSILVADRSALLMPELIPLGWPRHCLLCTDGFYRAVDHYGLFDDVGLMTASLAPAGVDTVLMSIREVERADPECRQHLRFKPADDATAVSLTASL